MPRKYTVESKYKNPDKYIDVLKKQQAEAWRSRAFFFEKLEKERGRYWFKYRKGATRAVALNDRESARKCRIDDHVVIHGRVKSIELNNIQFSLGEVRLIDD